MNRGIKLIPSDMQLFGVENPKAQLFLKKALSAIDNQYDFVFIDCPQNLYLGTQNGLFASQYYASIGVRHYI